MTAMANSDPSKPSRPVSTCKPVVLGTEVEYGITITNDPSFNPVTASTAIVNAHAHGAQVMRWSYDDESPGRDARGFSLREVPIDETDSGLVNAVLHNGARLYVDHAHPEYATPECANPLEATLYDKAGELIMHRAATAVNQRLEGSKRMLIHKNNSDGKGNSYGAHENYLVPRSVPFGDIVHHITSFFVSRQILTGSGKVGSEHGRRPVDFQLTQRADFFEEEVGLETTLKRPIVNTRDEPHADPEKYRRLHVIFGDATMSEVQTFVKLGTTALLLEALADGALGQPQRLVNPVGDVTAVSHDLGGKHVLELADGSRTSALDLQWLFLEILEEYAGSKTLDPVYKRVLVEWRDLLEDLTRGWRSVADRLDWAGKLSVLQGYVDRDGTDWSDPKFALIDLQYHDIDPIRGIHNRLVAKGLVRQLFTSDEVLHASTNPPENTRAWFRGQCLSRYPGSVVAANWDSLLFDIGKTTLVRVPMMDPLRGTRSLTEGLLDDSKDAAALIDNLGAEDDRT